jgi:hypothetical protein
MLLHQSFLVDTLRWALLDIGFKVFLVCFDSFYMHLLHLSLYNCGPCITYGRDPSCVYWFDVALSKNYEVGPFNSQPIKSDWFYTVENEDFELLYLILKLWLDLSFV